MYFNFCSTSCILGLQYHVSNDEKSIKCRLKTNEIIGGYHLILCFGRSIQHSNMADGGAWRSDFRRHGIVGGGLEFNSWRRSHHWLVKSPETRESEIGSRKEGVRNDCPVCQLWIWEERPGLVHRARKGVNPVVFPFSFTACAMSVFSVGIIMEQNYF